MRAEAAVEDADDAAVELHRAGKCHVDSALVPDRLTGHDPRLAGEQARVAHRIAADVPEAAAAPLRVQAYVAVARQHEGERAAQASHAADSALAHQFGDTAGQPMMAVHERLGDDDAAIRRGGRDAIDIAWRQRDWFLAEHVFASRDGAERPLHVEMIRQRHVHRVHPVVGQQRLVASVGDWNLPLRGVPGCALQRSARDAHQLAARRGANGGNQRAVDASRAEQAPPEQWRRHRNVHVGGKRGGLYQGCARRAAAIATGTTCSAGRLAVTAARRGPSCQKTTTVLPL